MEIAVWKLIRWYTLKLSIFLCRQTVCCCLNIKLTSRTSAVSFPPKSMIRESMAVVRTKLAVLRSCGKMEVCVGSVITTSWSTRLRASPTSIVPPETNSRVCKAKKYHYNTNILLENLQPMIRHHQVLSKEGSSSVYVNLQENLTYHESSEPITPVPQSPQTRVTSSNCKQK